MKSFFIAASLLLTAQFTFSQTDTIPSTDVIAPDSYWTPEPKPIAYGFYGGVNIANARLIERGVVGSGSPIIGFRAGVFAEVSPNTDFSFQTEINVNQVGFKDRDDNETYRLTYLAIPFLVKYTVGQTGISLYLGPQHSISIKGEGEGVLKSDQSIVGGVGFRAKETKLIFYGRYQYGLRKYKSENGDSFQNTAFSFTAGFRFMEKEH